MIKFISSILEDLGFKSPKSLKDSATINEVNKLFARVPIDKYFGVSSYDKESGIFIIEHKDEVFAGILIEVPVLSGIGVDSVRDLEKQIYNNPAIPENSIIQWTLYASPNIESITDSYESLKSKDDSIELVKIYTDWLKKKTSENILNGWNASVRNFTLLFSLKIKMNSLKDFFDGEKVSLIKNLKENLIISLKNIFGGAFEIDDKIYLLLLRSILNPYYKDIDALSYIENGNRLSLKQDQELRNHLIDKSTIIYVGEDFLKFVNNGRASFSMIYGLQPGYRGVPENLKIETLFEMIGSYFRIDNLNIDSPFLLTVNLQKMNSKEKAKIQNEAEIMLKQKNFSAINPKIEERQNDYVIAVRSIEEGRSLWKMSMFYYIYGKSTIEEIRNTGKTLKMMTSRLGLTFEPEILPTVWLYACLPLEVQTEHFNRKYERSTIIFDGNCPVINPIVGDWKGTKTPTIPLLSRRGQLMFFDLFDSDGGYSAAILAPTGRGKSFLTNHIIFNYLSRPDSLVRVVDVGDSYWGLSQLFNGTYIAPSPTEKIVLNPFYGIKNLDEEINNLTNLVLALSRVTETVRDHERNLVQKSIIEAYNQSQDSNFGLNEVVEKMIEIARDRNDPELMRFAELGFVQFVEGGTYDYMFNGEPNISLDNKFVVLEMKGMKDDKVLLRSIILAFFQLVNREIYLSPEKRSLRKIVIWDEWWRAANEGKFILDFTFGAVKEYRKFNAGMVLVTQNFADFFESMLPEMTKNIYMNLEYVISLQQPTEEWIRLKNDSTVLISDFELDVLSTIKTEKGRYSEMFIMRRSGGRGIGRLVVPPFYRWIYTTDATEVSVRSYFMKEYGNIKKAIEKCIEWEEKGRKLELINGKATPLI